MHDEVIKRLREEAKFPFNDNRDLFTKAADAIEELQKRKHGKWEWDHHNGYSYCSCCNSVSPHEDQYGEYCDEPNFCPNCGADMRGDSDA